MYLARQKIRGVFYYFIRESFLDHETDEYRSRNLVELGPDPAQFLNYPGGNSYYVDEQIYDLLSRVDVKPDPDELERVFWPFIKADIRYVHDHYGTNPYNAQKRKVTADERDKINAQVKNFDRRRLHYLRYGAIDQGRIHKMPEKFYRPLLDKSRDEKEELYRLWENDLQTREYKQYVYVIFDLQRYFSDSNIARIMPQGLDQGKIDDYFLHEFCRLAENTDFWAGINEADIVPLYLQRYLVMFYDYDYGPSTAWDDYLNSFMNSRRFYNPPGPSSRLKPREVSEIFGETNETLQSMSKEELSKLYRSRAHDLHPDKGGEHEEFVRLSEAYRDLMRRKK